jgi:hypothetical protein
MQSNSYQIDQRAKSSFSFGDIKQVLNEWLRKLLPIGQDSGSSRRGNQEPESSSPESANSDAEFLGWQKTPAGKIFALYNVSAKQHPLYRSTVSEQTLRQQHLDTPPTPDPQGQLKRFDREE